MSFAVNEIRPECGDAYPSGTVRLTYTSGADGVRDWALHLPGKPGRRTIVYLHGSFTEADQIFKRQDIRDYWLSRIMAGGYSLLSVTLRGTAYMSPAATADLHDLLAYARRELGADEIVLLGGSGGASSAIAYAVLHPEDIQGVIAMGMCDILARLEYARQSASPVLQELIRCVTEAYGGTPEELPGVYAARSALAHAERLTMPVVLTMGEADALIPVAETRRLAAALRHHPGFVYVEVPGGDHDSALWVDVDLDTLQVRTGNEQS